MINDWLSDKEIAEQLVQHLEIAVGTRRVADKIVETLSDKFRQDTELARHVLLLLVMSYYKSKAVAGDMSNEALGETIIRESKGRTGLKRFLMGSVANGVMQHAHCPVLLVR